MKKLILLGLLTLFVAFASNGFADQRVITHTYTVDDSMQDRSTAGLPGAVSNTWKIVTTGADTSETYTIATYEAFTLVARVDSINAADSAEFAVIPYVSTGDTTCWAAVPESLYVEWGTVVAPSYYYQTFTKIRCKLLRFITFGRGGNDSCHVHLSLYRHR